jgi:hypothetical protein
MLSNDQDIIEELCKILLQQVIKENADGNNEAKRWKF